MYIPINVKTDYYLLNSLIKVKDLVSFCVKKNIKVCCICDNNLSATFEFYNLCVQNNIKPCIGLEILYDDKKIYLYANNYDGYRNLLKINTLMQKDKITKLNLVKYSSNLTAIISYDLVNLYNEFSFYDNLYIEYKNSVEKQNALIITTKVVYNAEIKFFLEEEKKYLEYLNMLGGLNNLNNSVHFEFCSDEKIIEFENFNKDLNLKFDFTKKHIPIFDKNKNSFDYLCNLSKRGLNIRLGGKVNDIYVKRLEYELNVINELGFTDYFLIVYDYVLFAKKNKILVGPGRGSAAGSLVSYSIGITDVDPIEYDLLFERFLNKDRVTMPDIDIDFDSNKREDVINYVKDKYGHKNVAIGLTYNTFKTKLVLRDVSKIMKVDSTLFEKFLNVIDRNLSLKDNLNIIDVNKFINGYEEIKEVYKISMKLENLKKNSSKHAAGVVICDQELDNLIPVNIENGEYITGVTMDYLEDIGILKMDFLGLKNLTTISSIIEKTGDDILKDINLNDERVISIFSSGKTDGIFQYETFAMKNLLKKLKPKSFEDLVAAVALVRPGPSDFLDEYIHNRDNILSIKYLDPSLEDILKETYGVILYQEQIIKILVKLGGFSLSNADIVRRAISKKKSDELINNKNKFVEGAVANNVTREKASFIFDRIAKFADFGFNKSHSVAYALIGYQMAYLKVHYDKYFTNEMLNDTKDKKLTENFLIGLKNDGIKIIKPDVNFSESNYYFSNSQLILPLSMIKGITKEIESQIINNKPYVDVFDFYLKNNNLREDVFELLIYSNSLRSLKVNIKTLINNVDIINNYADLGGVLEKPLLSLYEEFDRNFIMNKELEIFGFYLSNHPSSLYRDKNIIKIKTFEKYLFKNINCVIIVEGIKKIKTKNGDDMAFLNVSDETGKIDAVIFKDNFIYLNDIQIGDLISIFGKLSKNQDKVRLVVNKISKESRK